MCLIITKGDNQRALLPRNVFDHVYRRNNDGFGAMWVEDGRVKHMKKLDMTADEIYSLMDELSERHESAIFHMRYRTHGPVIPGLCHPFRILHKNRHGKDLFMMHNGVISGFSGNLSHGQSDTTNFKDKILVPLLTRNPDVLEDETQLAALEKLTSGSRLIFLDSEGKVTYLHKEQWNNRYDLTLSNTYMLPAPEYKPQTHHYTSTGNNVIPFEADIMRVWRIVNGKGQWVNLYTKGTTQGYCRVADGTLLKDGTKYCHGGNTSTPVQQDTDLDDDLPDSMKDSGNSSTAMKECDKSTEGTLDEKLRYARIVHNTHDHDVACRTQMLADVLGMSNGELDRFVDEDPEAASIFMAEMFEIIMEMNTLLKDDHPNMCFDEEELIERGDAKNHMESMNLIMAIRRRRYEKMIEDKRRTEDNLSKMKVENAA